MLKFIVSTIIKIVVILFSAFASGFLISHTPLVDSRFYSYYWYLVLVLIKDSLFGIIKILKNLLTNK